MGRQNRVIGLFLDELTIIQDRMEYLHHTGMDAHSTRDINKGVENLHFLLEIPLNGVFTPYGSSLDARRPAFCKSAHLIQGRHSGVAREGRN